MLCFISGVKNKKKFQSFTLFDHTYQKLIEGGVYWVIHDGFVLIS